MQQSVTDYFIRKKNIRQSDIITVVYLFPCRTTAKSGTSGKNPVIASVSFGAKRMFHLKHRYDKNLNHKLVLETGSLLVMKGETQHYWLHQIPKTKKKVEARINLTFRIIK